MSLKNAGFTLVEVLVASTIGAFIALVAVGALRAITASAEMVDRNISTAAEVRFASNMIAKDLINLYRDPNQLSRKFIGIVEDSGQGNLSYLVFYTLSRAKARIDQPEGDIYEVEYYLVKDEEKSVLMRRFWPNPDKEETEPRGILTVLAENIDVFEVRYFDGEDWYYEWPEEMQNLPLLVEVNIVAKQLEQGKPTMESFFVNFARSTASTGVLLETGGETQTGTQRTAESGQGATTDMGSSAR